MMNGVMMSPVVPDDANPRGGRRSPVSDSRPDRRGQTMAALQPAKRAAVPARRSDAIAGLINDYKKPASVRPKADRKAKPQRAARAEPKAKPTKAAKARDAKPLRETVRRAKPDTKAAKSTRAAADAASPKKRDVKAKPAKKESKSAAKPDRKAKQPAKAAPVRRIASR
jgi:hypothetical protein